jgi:hypothetical protein
MTAVRITLIAEPTGQLLANKKRVVDMKVLMFLSQKQVFI